MPSAPVANGSATDLVPPVQDTQQGAADNDDAVDAQTGAGATSGSVFILPPRTPGRISLSDLVADPEDVHNHAPSATPNDHVTWKHVPGLMNTPSSVYTTQRGSKRARSSSPSSSQAKRSRHFHDGDVMDMTRLSQSLRRSQGRHSPQQDDPAAVLWHNYAGKPGVEPVLPPMPLNGLSPHTPNHQPKEGSFRRAQSCTNEWPTSSTKRRKIRHQDPHGTTKEIFASKRKLILKRDEPRQSRVSILLDSLQESVAAKRFDPEDPSSSSPLPDRYHNVDLDCAAPPAEGRTEDAPTPSGARRRSQKSNGSPLKHDKSSEFGGLDLDDEELQAIEHAFTQHATEFPKSSGTVASKPERAIPEPKCSAVDSKTRSADHMEPKSSLAMTSKTPVLRFCDDDDDDLLLDDELLQLADQLTSQKPSTPNPQHDQRKESISWAKPLCDGAMDDFCKEDDDDMWDELDSQLTVAGNSTSNGQRGLYQRAIKRYLIEDVHESTYDISSMQTRPEKVLSLKDEKTGHSVVLLLRQSWYDTRCTKGSYLHLIGAFDRYGQCVVDDNCNMIILHPDHLISATVVGDAITCLRRATLQDRIKATSPPERPQVFGHILHEVFGEAMKLNDWEMHTFNTIVRRLLPNYLEALYECQVPLAEAEEYLMSRVPLMKAWAAMFVSDTFVPDAVLKDRQNALVPTAINKLLEVEEHVWSPMYGLKGNIDATVQAQMQLSASKKTVTLVVPLELKTGKRDNVESHRAQTALYTLLLSDRYDVNVTSGILYYMETAKTFRIDAVRHEIRQMIQWRNEVACYVRDKLDLPPMARREHLCKRCYAQTSCFTYHKLVENGDGETSGMKYVFDDAVRHMTPIHQEFFRKWDDLLTKEERDSMKFRRELWTMLSTEREQVGRCFANVVIEPLSAKENTEASKINRFTYTFTKHKAQPGFSFTESQITSGEPIVISDEKGHFALANGFITYVSKARITVSVDRRLRYSHRKGKNFDAEINQSFEGIMDVARRSIISPNPSGSVADANPILYRIDKDEFSNGMATVRNNLIRLMENDLFKVARLRQLIVEGAEPKFKAASTAYNLPSTQATQLNPDQRQAIEKVMSAKDYALVLGMPGTGKTTTIAHIIRALVGQGKSVLLTSYTHTAVDNILLKIRDDSIPILRLGSTAKVHPEVREFADLSGVPKKTVEELEHSWTASKVVATTCLSINHGIFNHRIFDYCIVDEASQITLPVCLGPIRFAHTFILVGDHYQLPPLVQNKEAAAGGLDVSLFKLLSDAQPQSVVNLEHQYRMAADIMYLSNKLIYTGRLKCGNDGVANRTLSIPNLDAGLEAHHDVVPGNMSQEPQCQNSDNGCWIRQTLMPSSPRATFLNTDGISAANETLRGTRLTNPAESTILTQLLAVLVDSGLPPSSIGVITFYRSQLTHLRHEVRRVLGSTAASDVEMHTADKFQGRDKEVILLSCVRSNKASMVGELLRDWRRLNVAITRGRSKLIIIGSQRTLAGSEVPVLEGLVKIIQEKGWMLNLPSSTLEGHVFTVLGETQTQGASIASRLQAQQPSTPTKTSRKPSQRSPLKPLSGNTPLPGQANSKQTSAGTKRQPTKKVQGRALWNSREAMLERQTVVEQCLDEMERREDERLAADPEALREHELATKEAYSEIEVEMGDDLWMYDIDPDLPVF